MRFIMFLTAFLFALIASLLTAILIVATQRFHGQFTLDSHAGVQKLHTAPTPRVGGLALFFGALIGGIGLTGDAQWLWWMICISALPAFLFGLVEDITKRVGVRARLLATIFSGLIFCILTSYQITTVDIPGIDRLLSFWLFSLLFTAFAIGGTANAINLIDGVNGLAAGTSIIILTGFALIAVQLGDKAIFRRVSGRDRFPGGFFSAEFSEGAAVSGRRGSLRDGRPPRRDCHSVATAQCGDFTADRPSCTGLPGDGDDGIDFAPRAAPG